MQIKSRVSTSAQPGARGPPFYSTLTPFLVSISGGILSEHGGRCKGKSDAHAEISTSRSRHLFRPRASLRIQRSRWIASPPKARARSLRPRALARVGRGNAGGLAGCQSRAQKKPLHLCRGFESTGFKRPKMGGIHACCSRRCLMQRLTPNAAINASPAQADEGSGTGVLLK